MSNKIICEKSGLCGKINMINGRGYEGSWEEETEKAHHRGKKYKVIYFYVFLSFNF